jgi:hypothetical protein
MFPAGRLSALKPPLLERSFFAEEHRRAHFLTKLLIPGTPPDFLNGLMIEVSKRSNAVVVHEVTAGMNIPVSLDGHTIPTDIAVLDGMKGGDFLDGSPSMICHKSVGLLLKPKNIEIDVKSQAAS